MIYKDEGNDLMYMMVSSKQDVINTDEAICYLSKVSIVCHKNI